MDFFKNSQDYIKGLLMMCSGIIGFALFNEHVLHIPACKLCHYQQALYTSIAVILFVHLTTRSLSFPFVIIITSLLFLINMGVAGYQVLLEQHIIELPALCQKPAIKAQTLHELQEHFRNHPHIPCDEVRWSLWGISMAGYNVIMNSVFILFNTIIGKRYFKDRV